MSDKTTTREKVISWWNNLISDGLRAGYAQKHLNSGIRYSSLTGREIEEIYLKETLFLEEKKSKFGMYKNDNIMNIQTINNKYYTELDVVMVETKDTSKLWLNTISNQLHYDIEEKVTHHQAVNQHIYFLSNEKPKRYDYVYHTLLDTIFQLSDDCSQEYIDKAENIRKVEATSDSSLWNDGLRSDTKTLMSKIPQQFIGHFITEFNKLDSFSAKGNVITKVKVRIDLHDNDISCDKWKIMTNNNGVMPLIDVLENTPFHKPDFSHLKVQTAVDWFANEIDNLLPYVNEKTVKQFNDLLEKANEMFKQQITEAWNSAYGGDSNHEGEQYYKETYQDTK
jgi:hypothetical protein